MSSNLIVPADGRGTVLQVAAFEDGIFAVFLLDREQGLLAFLFACQRLFLRFLAGCLGTAVGEEIQLIADWCPGDSRFGLDVVGGNVDSADGERRIKDLVTERHDSSCDLLT